MGAAPREAQGVLVATGRVIGQSLSVAVAGATLAAQRQALGVEQRRALQQ